MEKMSPDVYIQYVWEKLTKRERQELMKIEYFRYKSFLIRWKWSDKGNNLSASTMSQAGFYNCGYGDLVQCAFCNGRLSQWCEGDSPLFSHSKEFQFCKFVKQIDCDNIQWFNKKEGVIKRGIKYPYYLSLVPRQKPSISGNLAKLFVLKTL